MAAAAPAPAATAARSRASLGSTAEGGGGVTRSTRRRPPMARQERVSLQPEPHKKGNRCCNLVPSWYMDAAQATPQPPSASLPSLPRAALTKTSGLKSIRQNTHAYYRHVHAFTRNSPSQVNRHPHDKSRMRHPSSRDGSSSNQCGRRPLHLLYNLYLGHSSARSGSED